ncbi:glycerate kinase [Microbacterium sp. JZ37]|uniref:glycerate kinase n=1 Tax=Microbacterium sp. JZ37 TaxID=2654193 RepID=UPI002B4819E9|nr:glycerate kinase [Microbacterium sp. JZ37]WRH16578.1 glycerate kinase [Microbacterium sp. JZ37]
MARIVIAPDSFKGTIAAADVAAALAEGWTAVRPDDEIVARPMADGGEGTLAAFAEAVPGAVRVPIRVTGPSGFAVDASWLRLPATDAAPGGIGVVELASTSGIELLGDARRPWEASTLGFGQAIAAALDAGVSQLVLGIGSSASTDGGTGLLTALGARFTDAFDTSIAPGASGLDDVAKVDLSRLRPLPEGGVQVLCDVTNPLLGGRGAAAVFGPQKGLDEEGVARADAGLARLVDVLRGVSGDTVAGSLARVADPEEAGAGAAGGAGYGLLVWGAEIVPGAERVAELTGLGDAIAGADLVVTGEGSYDGQSASGKAPAHVSALAEAAGARVAIVAGRIAADTSGLWRALSLTELAGSSDAAIADPATHLRAAGSALAEAL